MNQKIVVFLKLGLFVLLALFFEMLILQDKLIVISSIQFAPLLAYVSLIVLFKDMSVPIITEFNKNIFLKSIFAIIIPIFLLTISYLIIKIFNINIIINNFNSNWEIMYPMIFAQMLGSIGEEIGWRSFLQTKLEKIMPVLCSSMMVGLIWGLWHIPVHLSNGIIAMLLFILMVILLSIIMSILLKNTKNNIIISVLLHTSLNITIFVLFNPSTIMKETFFIITSITLIFAVILIIINRNYLLKQKTST
jgi:membrane protease YdiL (CAAX protease family)